MASALDTYKAKRDFAKTAEPRGRRQARRKSGEAGFVVQKHDATRLHYDFRLEHDGVLWSWAVTRGPSLDPAEKRLAVHVEDHPLDYADFEGTIPKGQYGGGSVIVWDNGTWVPAHDPAAMMKKGHIEFELKGHKLSGHWHLVRLRPRPGEKRDNWLLMKADDKAAKPGFDILEQAPASTKSGLTIEEIGTAEAPVWQSKPRKGTPRVAVPKKRAKASDLAFVPPCLATLRTAPPVGRDWIHEVKFDGYRIQAHIENGAVRLYTRTGLDWTDRFGSLIVEALGKLDCADAIVDGEVVVLAKNGVSSFSGLQAALSDGKTGGMLFYTFDLLHLDGAALAKEPLVERKAKLAELLGNAGDGAVRYSDQFEEPGKIMLEHACRLGLEGVISKRADAPYRSGRGHDWIKSKCTKRQEFVILGYLPSAKTGRGLRSLIVGYHEDGELRTAGHVGTGFKAKAAIDLKKRLDALRLEQAPFSGPGSNEKGAVWAKPVLVAEIEYGSITDAGILRHASFQGLREDKPAEQVGAETPADERQARRKPKAGAGKARKSAVTLTNPDKLLWPEAGVTKQGLLDHYQAAWPYMERFVVNRPLSLVRAPDGVAGKQRFFQKHASKGMDEAIRTMADPEDGEELLYIDSFDGVAALVQLGTVEIHIWGSTIAEIEKPDQVVFDLDPDEGLGIEDVRAATGDVRRRLDELGLPNVVKPSGGKGFHVIVPLKPKAGWDEVKTFAHDFARAMEQSEPERYTATLSKKARTGRIFIDYLRNGRGSTTVAPWSSRAKPQATVSATVSWADFDKGIGPGDFTIGGKALAAALRKPDAWADFDKIRKALR